MYAVIKTGGKQYRVAHNDVLTIEKLAAEEGEKITFGDVLMLGGAQVAIGAPFVAGASVEGEVLEQTRGAKVYAFKRRRRKHSSKRLKGHRQYVTRVRVTDIVGPDGARASEQVAQTPAPQVEAAPEPAPAAAASAAMPENLLEFPNGERDDLTKLTGVSEGAQEHFYDLGVYHVSQIAEWSPEQAATVAARLNKRGAGLEGDAWLQDAKASA